MNTKKFFIGTGIAILVALVLVAGGWLVTNAYAQTQTPNAFTGACHNNQAVLDLLKTNANDLQAQRQAGKSLLEIATAKGVSEKDLADALLDPMDDMHAWMAPQAGNYPQSTAAQMTQYMRDWIAKDVRETKFGTMTDIRLFGGIGAGNMMNGSGGMMNGSYNGMTNGRGMMGGNGFGGMMNGNGMMGR